jgi:hypothetical protein
MPTQALGKNAFRNTWNTTNHKPEAISEGYSGTFSFLMWLVFLSGINLDAVIRIDGRLKRLICCWSSLECQKAA